MHAPSPPGGLRRGRVGRGQAGRGPGWATSLSGAASDSPARHGGEFIPPHHTLPPFRSRGQRPHLSSGLIINNGL